MNFGKNENQYNFIGKESKMIIVEREKDDRPTKSFNYMKVNDTFLCPVNHTYFIVSEYPNFGHLGNLNFDSMIRGSRVINDEYEMEHIRDFSLWKGW